MFNYEKIIKSYKDYPKKGIMFRDINPVLSHPDALDEVLSTMEEWCYNLQADVIVSPESRGFIFGVPVANRLSIPFVPVMKPGKLPGDTYQAEYEKEYGKDVLQIQKDSIIPGYKVVIIDDLIATGYTLKACADLVEIQQGEVVGIMAFIELKSLNGRQLLSNYDIRSIVKLSA